VCLALVGGAAGLLLALWGADLVRLFPLPPIEHLIDLRVLAFTAALSVVTGIVFGLVPAWHASRVDVVTSLKDGASSDGAARSRLRGGLLVTQVALSFSLLIGAGLLVRSLRNVRTSDTGMDIDHTLLVSVDLDKAGYSSAAQSALYATALERLRALPGVRHASAAEVVPLNGVLGIRFTIPGRDSLYHGNEGPDANFVGPDFFATLGIPLRLGRTFTAGDRVGTSPVVVVNETMARTYWPGQSPIGQCMRLRAWGADTTTPTCTHVVGVVADTKSHLLSETRLPGFYLPILQQKTAAARTLFVQTSAEPATMITPVRRAMQTLSADLPFVSVTPMSELLEPRLLPFRLGALLFTLFGGIALLLAAIGLYGVLAYGVAQRTREIGVRMALGARHVQVVRLVVRQGLGLTLVGIVAGVGIAAAGTRFMHSLLYGVSATDPVTFVGIAIVLVVVALVATWLPARRAARVDPMVALRSE
jgi:predicted permease